MTDDMRIPLGTHGYEFLADASAELPDDPQFDRWLARVAGEVNEPGPTPHAEMWAAIAAAQPAPATTTPATRVLRFRSRSWGGAALLAAALLIGIGVDRLLTRSVGTPSAVGGPARVAAVAAPESSAVSSTPERATDAPVTAPRIAPPAPATRAAARPASGEATPGASSPSVSGDAPAANNLYRLAAVQTLSQAEALLTAYRASGVAERDPAAARQLGRWGREVLSSTRLLLDSPAGDDPQMRPLLNDLELVLVQIIRLSGTPLDASERALIDRSLRERDLLPRIHTAVPAGTIGTASND